MSEELDEVMIEFITESYESLDDLDRQLVTLEQSADPDSLAGIFRAIHTIKGTSGFLGLSKLESVTHVGENLLSKLRDGKLDVTQDITTALLAMVDAVRAIIEHVEADGQEGSDSHDDLIAELSRLEQGSPAPAATPTSTVTPAPTTDAAAPTVSDVAPTENATSTVHATSAPDATPDAPSADVETTGDDSLASAAETDSTVGIGEPTTAVAEPAATSSPETVAPTASGPEHHVASESIRVDVGLLDDLMNLVGELVLARNQILQFAETQHDTTFGATTQRLNLITTELQEGVMRTRMQPIENVWNKFPRVIRDLTMACGKRARLEMDGKHTELDKTLLEAIKDPLTHLVRNSVDHGLESPEERRAAGKPDEGTVRLRAYHEGGQVIIEIGDDGHGIDPAIIRNKAVEKGLMSADEAAARSDREIIDIIFQAGFSTAAAVTNISGRGVGMDVVRTNIESIGGSVDVHSQVGVGTTFTVKIPLTLAIIPALVVECDGDRFAIPQVSLLELVRIDGHDPQSAIEYVHGAPVYRLRGRLLPIVYLHEVFGQDRPADSDGANIVVLQADDREFGLVVGEISDTAEIVVKPLARNLKQAAAFAGSTIMGDGRVALILDVLGIAQHAEVGSAAIRKAHPGGLDEADGVGGHGAATKPMLVVGIGDRRFVLPLDTISRLDEVAAIDVREAGSRQVVHYRDRILPLVDLASRLGVRAGERTANLSVLICSTDAGEAGLIVDEIHDITDQPIEMSDRTAAFGVLGTTVVRDEVTDVLDLEVLVAERRAAHHTTYQQEVSA